MISGAVVQDEARIRVTVRGPGGESRSIEAMIDTGYSGYLSLPPDVIRDLELMQFGCVDVILADGSYTYFDVYEARVVWDRRRIDIEVDESDALPLVGTRLLRGYDVNIQMTPNGQVTLRKLKRRR